MQDRLEPGSRRRVAEHEAAQTRAVERAVGASKRRAERRQHGRVPRLSGGGQRVGEAIGVGDIDAERGEGVGDGRLAAADASGEPDDEGHG